MQVRGWMFRCRAYRSLDIQTHSAARTTWAVSANSAAACCSCRGRRQSSGAALTEPAPTRPSGALALRLGSRDASTMEGRSVSSTWAPAGLRLQDWAGGHASLDLLRHLPQVAPSYYGQVGTPGWT